MTGDAPTYVVVERIEGDPGRIEAGPLDTTEDVKAAKADARDRYPGAFAVEAVGYGAVRLLELGGHSFDWCEDVERPDGGLR